MMTLVHSLSSPFFPPLIGDQLGRTKRRVQVNTLLTLPHTATKLSKTDVCVGNLLAAIFGDQRIEAFREKGE